MVRERVRGRGKMVAREMLRSLSFSLSLSRSLSLCLCLCLSRSLSLSLRQVLRPTTNAAPVLVSGDWQDAARAAAGEAGSASTEGSEDDREERARSARVGVAADKAFLEQNVQLWREQECFVAPELHLSGIALIGAGNSLEERGGEGGGGRGEWGDRRRQGAARRPYGVKLEIVAATCDGFGVGPASRSFYSSSSEEEEEDDDEEEEWEEG